MQRLTVGLNLHGCTLREPAPAICRTSWAGIVRRNQKRDTERPEASACALAFVLTGWASGIRLKAVGSVYRLPQKASGIALPGAFSYPRLTALVTRVVASSSGITSFLTIG